MNMQAIANPHRIYPGQTLYLERSGGYARLRTSRSGNETVKLSPRVRSQSLADLAIPTIQMHSDRALPGRPPDRARADLAAGPAPDRQRG